MVWLIILLGIGISIVYTRNIRRAGMKDPMMADMLTSRERMLVMVTAIMGVAIPIPIYYFGWKQRFPLKAQSVRHILGEGIALLMRAAFYTLRRYVLPHFGKHKNTFELQLAQGEREAKDALQNAFPPVVSVHPQTTKGPLSEEGTTKTS